MGRVIWLAFVSEFLDILKAYDMPWWLLVLRLKYKYTTLDTF